MTDGSNLYPTILAELWPDARHQLCVFHVLKDLHEQVLDAVRRQRQAMSRRGNRGPEAEAGRRPKGRAKRPGLTNKEKSSFVHQHRYLVVKRREKMTRQERIDLATMQSYLPELKVLRDFVDRLEMLFEEHQSEALAWGRHAALVANRRFLKVPELADGAGDAGGGEVREDDRLPEESGESAGADEQPCGAGQPQTAARGEGPVQMADTAHDGAVPGAADGPVLEARTSDLEPLA